MKSEKIDGVVETVHYAPDGQIAYVRAYQRRGAAFSDVVLIGRADLLKILGSGSAYYTGERICGQGSQFKTFDRLQVVSSGDGDVIHTTPSGNHDDLGATPLL